MNNERVITTPSVADTTSFNLLINGEARELEYEIISISVVKEVNKIPYAKLVIKDGETSTEKFELSEKPDFSPGTSIEIKAGADGINTTLFKGMVIKQAIRVRQQGNSFLQVECKDESVKLTVGRKNVYYENMRDDQVIKNILNENQLSGSLEETKGAHKELVQHYASDWDFMVCRAEANAMLVLVDDGVVNIQTPKTDGNPKPLIYGSTVFEFEAELDARYQWKTVKASAWDYTNQKLLEASASSVDFEETGDLSGGMLSDVLGLQEFEIRHSGLKPADELQSWAKATLLKSRLAKIRGRVKFIGQADVKPGTLLELKGLGERFNGIVYVTGVRHSLSEGSWYTDAQFGLKPNWFHHNANIMEREASGLVPGIHGLQVGIVEKIHDDPDGNHRVQVKLPIIDGNAKGTWARVASLDAGENRGAFFRPEVNDEVIVGFINGDPREAVILGMLNSKAKPAPYTAEMKNAKKGFITREELTLEFDDQDKVITIKTPGNNSAVLSDKDGSITFQDQSGNKVTMESSGITIQSIGDINIQATGSVNINATASLNAQANTGVTLNSNASFTAFGAATSTLNSGASTVIASGGVIAIG